MASGAGVVPTLSTPVPWTLYFLFMTTVRLQDSWVPQYAIKGDFLEEKKEACSSRERGVRWCFRIFVMVEL